MKLSEAIREGAKLRPQAFGEYLKAGGTCALGAAYEALCVAEDRPVRTWFSEGIHPWETLLLALMDGPCPACGYLHYENQIVHLNDTHKWTRERIADWVATQEPAHETE